MSLEQYYMIAQIVASLAVVITLIVLIVEIRQSTSALSAQSRQSDLSAAQNELFTVVNHPEISMALAKEEPLTPEENVKVGAFLIAMMRAREFSWLQFRSGLIDERQWKTEGSVIQPLLSSPRTRRWWTVQGRALVNPEFAVYVDGLTKAPPMFNMFEASTKWSSADPGAMTQGPGKG